MNVSDHFRAQARRSVALDATLLTVDGQWRTSARLVDLGLGGARLDLREMPPKDSKLKLQVLSPHLWDPLVVRGSIAHFDVHSPTHAVVGLSFEHDTGTTIRAITELLSANAYD